MAYYLLLDPCKFPVGDLKITFSIDSANYLGAQPQKLKELGSFTIGTGNDNEVIFFPNVFEVKIKTDVEFDKWLTFLKDLRTEETLALIQDEDDKYIFRGYVQKSSVKGDMFRKTIGFRSYDQILNLKNFAASDNDLAYGNTEKVKIIDILKDIFTTGTYFQDGTNYINDVVSLCSYEAKIAGSPTYVGFDDFGVIPYSIYFNPASPYDTVLDVVKSILVTYGCVGYIGTDEKFYIIPRVYQNNSLVTIQNNEIADIDTKVMRKMEGLKIYVFTGTLGSYQTFSYGDIISNPDRVEEIRSDQNGGTLPSGGGGNVNLWLWSGGIWNDVELNYFRRKNADGSYTSPTSLWRLTGDDTWAIISKDRLNYNVTLKGKFDSLTMKSDLLTTHNPKQFYKLAQFPDEYLRPRKLKYDLNENKVEIDLLSN